MTGRGLRVWTDLVVTLLLFTAGTALGTAGRRGPGWLQASTAVLVGLVVVVVAALVTRALVRRRRARRASPDAHPPLAPLYGSERWVAQRRTGALAAAPVYGLYAGWFLSVPTWWVPFLLLPGGLALGLAWGGLVSSSRRRREAAARDAHPGQAVVPVVVDPVAGMRLTQWATAVGATVVTVGGGDAVVAADEGGVALWRPGRPGRLVHRWPWSDVELSRTASATDVPHLVLTLLGPVPAVRARAVPATRRRFDLPLSVRSARRAGVGTWGAATTAALDGLLARRPDDGAASSAGAVADVDPLEEAR